MSIFEYVIATVAVVILLVCVAIVLVVVIGLMRSEREDRKERHNKKLKHIAVYTHDYPNHITMVKKPASQSRQCDYANCIYVKMHFARLKKGVEESSSACGVYGEQGGIIDKRLNHGHLNPLCPKDLPLEEGKSIVACGCTNTEKCVKWEKKILKKIRSEG